MTAFVVVSRVLAIGVAVPLVRAPDATACRRAAGDADWDGQRVVETSRRAAAQPSGRFRRAIAPAAPAIGRRGRRRAVAHGRAAVRSGRCRGTAVRRARAPDRRPHRRSEDRADRSAAGGGDLPDGGIAPGRAPACWLRSSRRSRKWGRRSGRISRKSPGASGSATTRAPPSATCR